jgi:hypothetical protein
MGLPTSRSITINDRDPIPASILNLLQDTIIGAKHPELELEYAHSMFTFASGWVNNNSGATLAATSPGAVAYCGLELPVGDRLITVKWGYEIFAAGTFQMRLYRQKLDGSALPELITPASGTTSDSVVAANGKTNIVTYNHVIADDYTYFLQVDASAATIFLFGAIVRHDNL